MRGVCLVKNFERDFSLVKTLNCFVIFPIIGWGIVVVSRSYVVTC